MKRFVGTFHKTGTVLLLGIFREISRQLDLPMWEAGASRPAPPEWVIQFDDHTRFFDEPGLVGPDDRCLVSVRDPRDVVVSAAHYHCKAEEGWLHQPRQALGGMTYQEKMNSLPSDEERFIFELTHSAGNTIRQMLAIDLANPNVSLTRLEALVEDVDLVEFTRIFEFFGFAGSDLDACLAIARERSLFGGATPDPTHVRSGGRRGVWRQQFTDRALAAYDEVFPTAAAQLGYD